MKELLQRYPALAACKEDIERAVSILEKTFSDGGKLLLCGNGGSCADCEHIVGELMKSFLLRRPMPKALKNNFSDDEDGKKLTESLQMGLPAISLPSQTALISAFANDVDASVAYAQLVLGYARKNDVLLCISTSGNSKNVVLAAKTAKALGIPVISLTGARESLLSSIGDVTVRVPETETFKVQELHLPVYHFICAELERKAFCDACQD